MNPVFRLDRVSKRFRTQIALSNVSLSASAGTVVALLGENGAGKTTALKILLGLVDADRGNAEVLGRDSQLQGQEIRRLIHPVNVRPIRLQRQLVDPHVIEGVRAFFIVYAVLFFVLMLALMGTGLDLETSFSAVATSMNNLGPGLGEVAANFQSVPSSAKLISALAMLLGRLEIFSLLVLLSPRFWTT